MPESHLEIRPAPTFDGSFPHHWTAEILPNRPMILPSRHYVYPAQVEEVERGALEVLISANNEAPFLVTCALGFRDPAAPTGLWSCPHPDWLCAVSGGYAYLIDTAEPQRFTMLHYRPVLAVFPAVPAQLLLFAGHHSIYAWGREGQAWESPRLSWEGITIDSVASIESGILHGHGWDLMTDKDLPFALDLATGQRV
jgi:hypothetical protein